MCITTQVLPKLMNIFVWIYNRHFIFLLNFHFGILHNNNTKTNLHKLKYIY